MERLVNVYRGGYLESFHSGSIAVCDATGRLLACVGDPGETTFIRSAAKPFQTVAMLELGLASTFHLTPQELALVSGSHGGESQHVTTAAAILRKGEFDESDLLCGTHEPLDEKAQSELRQSGELPSPLHNNCSGKHAGMLLTSKLLDLPTSSYTTASHPLQSRIKEILARFAEIPEHSVPTAVDGCGVPTFYLSLFRTAFAYARLAALAHGRGAEGLDAFASPAREVFRAMTRYPDYVAGSWSMTTPLIQSQRGELLAKEGAEGFYAMAFSPGASEKIGLHLGLEIGDTVGVAIKIGDGSMARGRNPAVLETLRQLGVDVSIHPQLSPFHEMVLRNWGGTEAGMVKAEFQLTVL